MDDLPPVTSPRRDWPGGVGGAPGDHDDEWQRKLFMVVVAALVGAVLGAVIGVLGYFSGLPIEGHHVGGALVIGTLWAVLTTYGISRLLLQPRRP